MNNKLKPAEEGFTPPSGHPDSTSGAAFRRDSGEELIDARDRLDSILEATADLIAVVDQTGTIIDCNDRVQSVLGYAREEVVGEPMARIVHPAHLKRSQEILAETFSEGITRDRECKMVRKDDAVIDVSLNTCRLRNRAGDYDRITCIISDITVTHSMGEAIRFAYAELERIFNATAEGMRVVDTDFNVLRVNDAHSSLSGVSKSEAVHSKCYQEFPGSLCHTTRCILSRIQSGEEFVEGEVDKERRDGVKLTCSLTATPLHGPDGQLIGMVESFRDITALRRAEEQLQHSQLLVSLGEMTAGIAHEVNNPLGSILLYSELLMASEAPAHMKKDLRVIHDEAKRAARIMSNLLTYSRQGSPQRRHLDLHKILERLLNMRRYEEGVHNISVSVHLQHGPLYVKGDSAQLSQLFMNQMLNAEEALISRGGGRIIITTRTDGEWAKVSIADDGVGIPEENLKQIFYPFFTTKQAGQSPGLGLSACYGIAIAHRGLIRAENNDIGGATFTVELPLADAPSPAAPSEEDTKVA